LLALIKDELAIANWQRCDPKAKIPYPKPQPRPGADGPKRIGGNHAMTPAECDAWFATRRAKE